MIEIYGKSRISKDIYLDQGFLKFFFSILCKMDLLNRKDLENIITKWLQNITLINKIFFILL